MAGMSCRLPWSLVKRVAKAVEANGVLQSGFCFEAEIGPEVARIRKAGVEFTAESISRQSDVMSRIRVCYRDSGLAGPIVVCSCVCHDSLTKCVVVDLALSVREVARVV